MQPLAPHWRVYRVRQLNSWTEKLKEPGAGNRANIFWRGWEACDSPLSPPSRGGFSALCAVAHERGATLPPAWVAQIARRLMGRGGPVKTWLWRAAALGGSGQRDGPEHSPCSQNLFPLHQRQATQGGIQLARAVGAPTERLCTG